MKRALLRMLRRWHARIGVTALVFFLLLAITGVALNHGHALDLDRRQLHAAWLARWYGLAVELPSSMYQAGHHTLVWSNGVWNLDGATLGENRPHPIGMVEVFGLVYIATTGGIYVYTGDRRLVEKIGAPALPAVPVDAVGTGNGRLRLRSRDRVFESRDGVLWQAASTAHSDWAALRPLSAGLQHELASRLVPGISLERLLADLHSGRILGREGPLLVDLLGLALAALGLSGTWVFARSPRRNRPDQQQEA